MSLSFYDFIMQNLATPPLMVTTLLTLAVLLVNGWTDTPNAIAGAVVTGVLPFRSAVLLAAVCNFLGVLCVTSVNASVAETIYSIASFGGGSHTASVALCSAMVAIVLWATLAWRFGIPTSESHALVAGISGAAVALEGGTSCIRWECWYRVLLGLALSILIGWGAGRLSQRTLRKIRLSPPVIRIMQTLGAAGTAFFHGAQDGQKFLGIFLLGVALSQGQTGEQLLAIPVWLMALCALFMSLGTLMGGRRIIDTIGQDMVSLAPQDGLAADLGNLLSLLCATFLGLPVSTTHTRTAALLGVGTAAGKPVSWTVAGKILLAWILTFPACLAISYWLSSLSIVA